MRLRSPVRLIVVIITLLIVIWMFYNFIIALITGQPFSFLGNSLRQEPRTFVVAGVDEDGYRTDLILLCQVNRKDNKVSVLQIPRDTRVENNGRNDRKINSAYYSGFEVLSREIGKVTGVTPEHYIVVDFAGFRDIIDAAGGVTIDVPMRMKYEDPVQDLVIDLEAGRQKLNGEKAEMYMRYRSGYAQGDVGRVDAQKVLYQAVADKLLSPLGMFRIPAVFSAVKKHTVTDFSGGEIFGLIRDVVAIGKENVEIVSLPGEGKYMYGASYFVPYKNQTQALIQEHFVTDET